MIEAQTRTPGATLTAQLVRQAETIAMAHGENALRQRRRDPWRWRAARLLWPLFSPTNSKGG